MTLLSLTTWLKVRSSSWTDYDYIRVRGLKLNTDKTNIMVFFSRDTSAIPAFTYDVTPLELVTQFEYLGITLTHDRSTLLRRQRGITLTHDRITLTHDRSTAAEKTADYIKFAIARVYKTGDSKGIKQRRMLEVFQVLALAAGLYGCQVWATSSLTYDSSKATPARILNLS